MLQRLFRRTALAVIAVSWPWAANGALAQERTAIQGVWSTPFTAPDHPAFMIEDYLCALCPPAALEHLRKLLADPANDKRPLQQLAQEATRLATEQRTGLLTDAGRARLKQNNAAANDAVIRCEPPDLLTVLRVPLPIVFTLNEDHVVIHHDHWNTVRKIALGGASTSPSGGPTRLGSSTARFDGPTLIVETRNLLGTVGGGFTTSDNARIVERWTTSRDGTLLTLELTIDDPESYRQPLVLIASRVRTPNEKILDLPPCEAISGKP